MAATTESIYSGPILTFQGQPFSVTVSRIKFRHEGRVNFEARSLSLCIFDDGRDVQELKRLGEHFTAIFQEAIGTGQLIKAECSLEAKIGTLSEELPGPTLDQISEIVHQFPPFNQTSRSTEAKTFSVGDAARLGFLIERTIKVTGPKESLTDEKMQKVLQSVTTYRTRTLALLGKFGREAFPLEEERARAVAALHQLRKELGVGVAFVYARED